MTRIARVLAFVWLAAMLLACVVVNHDRSCGGECGEGSETVHGIARVTKVSGCGCDPRFDGAPVGTTVRVHVDFVHGDVDLARVHVATGNGTVTVGPTTVICNEEPNDAGLCGGIPTIPVDGCVLEADVTAVRPGRVHLGLVDDFGRELDYVGGDVF